MRVASSCRFPTYGCFFWGQRELAKVRSHGTSFNRFGRRTVWAGSVIVCAHTANIGCMAETICSLFRLNANTWGHHGENYCELSDDAETNLIDTLGQAMLVVIDEISIPTGRYIPAACAGTEGLFTPAGCFGGGCRCYDKWRF